MAMHTLMCAARSDDGSTCTADVAPGLTCVRNGGLFVTTVCTNNTPKAYLVAMTTSCAGGEYSTPATFHSGGPGGGYYSGGSTGRIDPEVKQDNIFVPANDSSTVPTGSCSLHASGVSFVAGPPPPPDAAPLPAG